MFLDPLSNSILPIYYLEFYSLVFIENELAYKSASSPFESGSLIIQPVSFPRGRRNDITDLNFVSSHIIIQHCADCEYPLYVGGTCKRGHLPIIPGAPFLASCRMCIMIGRKSA